MKLWDNIEGIGSLYTEINLVVGNEPILFVCTNQINRYLIMTLDYLSDEYVFVKIADDKLLEMLTNKITMESAFRSAETICVTYTDGKLLRYTSTPANTFSSEMLPKAEAYFELTSTQIAHYIEQLDNEKDTSAIWVSASEYGFHSYKKHGGVLMPTNEQGTVRWSVSDTQLGHIFKTAA